MDQLIEQVHGILTRAGVDFMESEERDRFFVNSGSAQVRVSFRQSSAGDNYVRITSILLRDIDVDADGTFGRALIAVNRANCDTYAKFAFYADTGTIVIESDLLGSHLQAAELIDSLESVCRTADGYDDDFKQKVGSGLTVRDWAAAHRAADELDI